MSDTYLDPDDEVVPSPATLLRILDIIKPAYEMPPAKVLSLGGGTEHFGDDAHESEETVLVVRCVGWNGQEHLNVLREPGDISAVLRALLDEVPDEPEPDVLSLLPEVQIEVADAIAHRAALSRAQKAQAAGDSEGVNAAMAEMQEIESRFVINPPPATPYPYSEGT